MVTSFSDSARGLFTDCGRASCIGGATARKGGVQMPVSRQTLCEGGVVIHYRAVLLNHYLQAWLQQWRCNSWQVAGFPSRGMLTSLMIVSMSWNVLLTFQKRFKRRTRLTRSPDHQYHRRPHHPRFGSSPQGRCHWGSLPSAGTGLWRPGPRWGGCERSGWSGGGCPPGCWLWTERPQPADEGWLDPGATTTERSGSKGWRRRRRRLRRCRSTWSPPHSFGLKKEEMQ